MRLATIALSVACLPWQAAAQPPSFVKRAGRHFTIDGRAWYINGTNQAELFRQPTSVIDDFLQNAQALGFNTVRTWGFCDGDTSGIPCFQPRVGAFTDAASQEAFRRLDHVIAKAAELNLRLIIPLVNNWQDYGGMDRYVAWCREAGACTAEATHDDFYTNTWIRTHYKDYVTYMLNRTNTVTNVKYRDDPTILMWELANEPRALADRTGGKMLAWVSEMAAYVKSLDANHLVGTGEEGWLTGGVGDWRRDGSMGADYVKNSNDPSIDAVSFHLYPNSYQLTDALSLDWIAQHVTTAHTQVGKPVYLGEFGSPVPRLLLGDFERGTEGWITVDGFAPPSRTTAVSQRGASALELRPVGGTLRHGQSATVERQFPESNGLDVRPPYQTVSLWVQVPQPAPGDLSVQLFVKSGDAWTWQNQGITALSPGNWKLLSFPTSAIQQPEKLHAVGIKLFGGATDYTGPLYCDQALAAPANLDDAMAQRNRRYGEWYDKLALTALDADGAFLWQLSGHGEDKSVVNHTDQFDVYYPEDLETAPVLQAHATYISKLNSGGASETFIRGDANNDEVLDISDAVKILLVLFSSGSFPHPNAADVNDSGIHQIADVNITDVIYLLNYLFRDGPAPPPPFPTPGIDPT